jgi:hypothetical protein
MISLGMNVYFFSSYFHLAVDGAALKKLLFRLLISMLLGKTTIQENYVPYMNSTLRKAIYKKRMYRGKFEKQKSDKNWEKYRTQRNLVNRLKRNSIRNYFSERCVGVRNLVNFGLLSSHFCLKKCKSGDKNIVLCEKGKVVNDNKEICDIFN